MPFRSPEEKLIYDRNRLRSKRHGDWRQVYVDCDGMCIRCGCLDRLEFHAPHGESRPERVLLCTECHLDDNHGNHGLRPKTYESKIHEDIDREIKMCGGKKEWMAMYMLRPKDG